MLNENIYENLKEKKITEKDICLLLDQILDPALNQN